MVFGWVNMHIRFGSKAEGRKLNAEGSVMMFLIMQNSGPAFGIQLLALSLSTRAARLAVVAAMLLVGIGNGMLTLHYYRRREQ